MDLVIRVKEIQGHCPVYQVGDSFLLKEGYKLVTEIPLMQSYAFLFVARGGIRTHKPEALDPKSSVSANSTTLAIRP